jgi:hypothetical protein
MKRLSMAISFLLVFAAMPALAQKPANTPNGSDGTARPEQRSAAKPAPYSPYVSISPGELKPTAEMWFYEQALRQYQDPKLAVRKAAEMRADQRQRRLESMRWFGFSNQRPRVSVDPITDDYSPSWVSNDDRSPNRWYGVGGPIVAARPYGNSTY